jgi:thermitase
MRLVKQRWLNRIFLIFGMLMLLSSLAYADVGDMRCRMQKLQDYDQLIVKTKRKLSSDALLKIKQGISNQFKEQIYFKKVNKVAALKKEVKEQGIYVIKAQKTDKLQEMQNYLAAQDWVEYVEPNYRIMSFAMPNDPYLDRQSYITRTEINNVWEIETSRDVLVAVVDSGIDYNHEDLEHCLFENKAEKINGIDDDGNGWVDDGRGYNFCGYYQQNDNNDPVDNYGHGTHLAGIIAAELNNERGIVGINSGAKIINVRFLDAFGFGTLIDAAMALRYAADMGAKIINCSWGFFYDAQTLREAISYAHSKGAVIVAAAGNTNSTEVAYPAGYDAVIAISALDLNRKKSWFSSYGGHIDFAAYGVSIFSTSPDNRYASKSGTSQSAAVVSGVISKLMCMYKDLNQQNIKNFLIQNTLDIEGEGKDNQTGYGLINIATFVQDKIENNISLSQGSNVIISDVQNFPNPFDEQGTVFGFHTDTGGEVEIKVFDLRGNMVRSFNDVAGSGYNTSITWDGKDSMGNYVPNGTYLYLLIINNNNQIKKISGKISFIR